MDVPVAVLEARQADETIKKLCAELMLRRPSTKGDYRLAYYWFLKDFCGIKMSFKTFEDLRRAPSPETVARRIRELKEEDPVKYGATFETEVKRLKRFVVMRDYYGNKRLEAWFE